MIHADLTGKLHQLRQMRNPYVHPRAGLGNRTLMKRVTEGYGSLELQAQEDAKTAVQVMIDFLRYSARKSGNLWEPLESLCNRVLR
jgi:hypothetical protein